MADGLSLRALEEELPIKVVGPLNLTKAILERDQRKMDKISKKTNLSTRG